MKTLKSMKVMQLAMITTPQRCKTSSKLHWQQVLKIMDSGNLLSYYLSIQKFKSLTSSGIVFR